ncbi:MAG: hypothetical protein II200_00250, partial [Bacteroidaceae bacterium]|nr:hypothetical protein [Bacteroidaceae bacterium]
ELAEAHLLRVLAIRGVCVLKRAERFCEFCEVRVKLNCEITILGWLLGIFYPHTENTEFTEAHWLRVLAMRAVHVRPLLGGGPT